MSRQDQYRVTVIIDGENTGVWDKMAGFGADSNETKYRKGGMGPEVPLGGTQTVDNGTVQRLYDLEMDHQNVKRWNAKRGKADTVVIKQPLDVNGAAFGDPLVYSGKLKRVMPPEVDSESSEAGLLEIEVSSAAIIG